MSEMCVKSDNRNRFAIDFQIIKYSIYSNKRSYSNYRPSFFIIFEVQALKSSNKCPLAY